MGSNWMRNWTQFLVPAVSSWALGLRSWIDHETVYLQKMIVQVRSDAHISVSRWCSFIGPSAAGLPVTFKTLVKRALRTDTLITRGRKRFETLSMRGHKQQCFTLSTREGHSCETLDARGLPHQFSSMFSAQHAVPAHVLIEQVSASASF